MQQSAKELGSINVCTETVLCLCMLHEQERRTERGRERAVVCMLSMFVLHDRLRGEEEIKRVTHIKYREREDDRERRRLL